MKYLLFVLITCFSLSFLQNVYATDIMEDLAKNGLIDKDYKEQAQKQAQHFREQVQKEQQEKTNNSKNK